MYYCNVHIVWYMSYKDYALLQGAHCVMQGLQRLRTIATYTLCNVWLTKAMQYYNMHIV